MELINDIIVENSCGCVIRGIDKAESKYINSQEW